MKRLFLGAFVALALLGGCEQQPPAEDILVSASNRVKPTPLPAPEPTPADNALIENVMKGLATSDYSGRRQVEMQIDRYLRYRQYSHLEAVEKAFQAWPDGDFFEERLEDYYDYCADLSPEEIAAWKKASPKSHVPKLVAAKQKLKRVYKVLRNDPPEKASAAKLESMGPLLDYIKEDLAGLEDANCPAYHSTKIELASLSGASRQEIADLLKDSDKLLPGYLPAYAEAANGRRPGWSGELQGDEPRNLAETIPAPPGFESELWKEARLSGLYHHTWNRDSHRIGEPETLQWDIYQPSFAATVKMLPGSADALNHYAKSTVFYGNDPKLLKELLASIGTRWDRNYWRSYFGFNAYGRPEAGKGVKLDPPKGALRELPIPDSLQLKFVKQEIGMLLLSARFPELEVLGQKYLSKTPPPYPSSRDFWDALSLDDVKITVNYDYAMKLNGFWKETYPDSIAAKICEAELLASWAYQARGTGYANTVSEQNMKLFRERNIKAAGIYEEVLKTEDRAFLSIDMARCLILSGDPKRGFGILQEVIEKDPQNSHAIRTFAYYLLPRWFGKTGDLKTLMDMVHKASPKEIGAAGKTHVICAVLAYEKEPFFETEITWKDAKQAFEDRLKQDSSNDWVRSHYAYAAYYARDHATAKKLVKALGDKLDVSIVGTKDAEFIKAWALAD